MVGLLLIIYLVSVSLISIVLGLAITFSIFHRAKWCSWYIVFQACILGTIALGCVNLISASFFNFQLAVVFDYIFRIMMEATMGVVCVLIPFFIKWIVNINWNKWCKVLFFTGGIGYFAVGLVAILAKTPVLALVIQSVIILSICLSSMIALWIKLRDLSNEHSRGVGLAFNITFLCMIPLIVLSFIFEGVREFSYPCYAIVFSIVMMVYFFIRFHVDSDRDKKIDLESKSFEQFKVTDRELSVIKLICDGLTNKEIASELNISVNTVNNHVANIFEKVGARSRVDLLNMIKTGPWD